MVFQTAKRIIAIFADRKMAVFVTVGTTEFDLLVDTVLQEDIVAVRPLTYCVFTSQELFKLGYTKMVIQYGRGKERPEQMDVLQMDVSFFRLKPSLNENILSAALVIGHAGKACLGNDR